LLKLPSDFAEEKAMGYTSGTTMEDRGLRDIERWRDKIEVRLDNRQVFFLFFGSALVACMLFVLGVIVGKRLESRGRAVSPEIEDPLALLDKVATSPRPAQAAVTFPQALFGTKNADKHAAKKTALVTTPTEVAPAPQPTAPSKPQEAPAVVPAQTAASKSILAAKPESKPAPVVAARPESKSALVAAAPAEKPPEPASAKAKPAETKESNPATIPTIAASVDSKSKGHFALQLSSFQDKNEAQAFAQKFDGERPYLIVSEIPGKGTWYRVRVGDYASAKDAAAAKQTFEKRHSVIAYVAQK
jgi:cell division septation protein DedD